MNESLLKSEVPAIPKWLSPVQEHHIDFLLEEEFAANPAFLTFFLEAAREHCQLLEEGDLPDASSAPDCSSVRSVMTDKVETDVLVVYQSIGSFGRIAILIEDKIRAGFQQQQAERYQVRGEPGKSSGEWDHFWTCLIAPERYTRGNQGFDTRISLETLKSFFDGGDARSRFKAGVLDRALTRFAQTGLQKKDETMTQFRSFYASKAEAFFHREEIIWPRARDAWWGDTWFNFNGGPLPKGVEIVHKAAAGVVYLAFRHTAQAMLNEVLAQCLSDSGIMAVQTGKSASFRQRVTKVTDFTLCEEAEPAISEALNSVRRLLEFYRTHEGLMPGERK